MKPIRVIPIGPVDRRLLDSVATTVSRAFGVPCSVISAGLDPAGTFHPERGQYHSTALLEALAAIDLPVRFLGVTSVDLYIPILTFVFGEAHVDGDCAVVSYHRLEQEFYGLPPDGEMTRMRLVKEAVHEIGHTYGLVHCQDYECVMAASHSVEWVDLKGQAMCGSCLSEVQQRPARSSLI